MNKWLSMSVLCQSECTDESEPNGFCGFGAVFENADFAAQIIGICLINSERFNWKFYFYQLFPPILNQYFGGKWDFYQISAKILTENWRKYFTTQYKTSNHFTNRALSHKKTEIKPKSFPKSALYWGGYNSLNRIKKWSFSELTLDSSLKLIIFVRFSELT